MSGCQNEQRDRKAVIGKIGESSCYRVTKFISGLPMSKQNVEICGQDSSTPSRAELKAKRIDELLDSCRDQVLQQIIGPFGLTPAMFDDKTGGNVTTTQNFEQGIVANEADAARHAEYRNNLESKIERSPYDAELPSKRKEMFQSGETINSAWTGKELPRDGRTHLDHVTSVERIERNARANLVMSKEERVAMANAPENLVPSESDINQSMGHKDKEEWAGTYSNKTPDKTNAERFGVDVERLKATKTKSEQHLQKELLKAQFKKQGQELLESGISEARKNALRHATGMLFYELVNGTYLEVKRIAQEPESQDNFVDHVIQALKNVAERVKGKIEHIFKSLLAGGVQGFISNLLTYIINTIVTTSAKVVTIIREGLKGLWEAVKFVANPPPGMTGIEVARQATKIIAGVITMSLGLIFDQTVEGFILSIPILAPLAGIISPAITAIITGVVTALVVFGIDRIFDWLSSSGTEILNAHIENMEASAELFERMAKMLQAQFDNSEQYQLCIAQYREIEADLSKSQSHISHAVETAGHAVKSRSATLQALENGLPEFKRMDSELDTILSEYEENMKD